MHLSILVLPSASQASITATVYNQLYIAFLATKLYIRHIFSNMHHCTGCGKKFKTHTGYANHISQDIICNTLAYPLEPPVYDEDDELSIWFDAGHGKEEATGYSEDIEYIEQDQISNLDVDEGI